MQETVIDSNIAETVTPRSLQSSGDQRENQVVMHYDKV